jgi:hypothetical protein
MEEVKQEVKQEEKVEYVTKKDFDALQNILLEALGKKEKEQPKEEVNFDTNLKKIEEEKITKEQMKREIELQNYFEDDKLYNYSEDEKRAMVNLSTDEIELVNLNKLSKDNDILEFLSNSQRKEIDKVLKEGSKQDKLNFKYKFMEYYIEAKDKFIKFEDKKNKEIGVNLSKNGINTNNNDSINVNSIRNLRLRNQVQQLIEKGAI